MGWLKGIRFLKRIPLLKLITINLSKSGAGVSLGRAGFRLGRTVTGKLYLWLGLPGTGLGYRKYISPTTLLGWIASAGRIIHNSYNQQGWKKGRIRRDPKLHQTAQRVKRMMREEYHAARERWKQRNEGGTGDKPSDKA